MSIPSFIQSKCLYSLKIWRNNGQTNPVDVSGHAVDVSSLLRYFNTIVLQIYGYKLAEKKVAVTKK